MTIDVTSRIEIARPRAVVAAFSADPDNVPRWYVNIKSVEWKTPRPVQVGSRIAFVAQFLGRRLVYTYEIVDLVQGERLVMRTAEGPFPMETSYAWRDTREGATHMALRNRGTPTGFSRLVAPFIALAVRRSTNRDLLRLKNILEAAH
ncbi:MULTISPECIES: SRPBCC family protein [unclassified Mesorhizobium]|uniref:SRPBCC family protein n=1 Tax=unclassified Mesorhizobium TaxID=325217 RepID=UPI001CCA6178|nr:MULTISPECIES: SRPBCC family protein [unclassified Mesorhizobium]MBZ9734794.1 SRPBCC family protein [Mesorhizobium sp. CA9]MBZ9827093.1 SRPBCC family protein [Mesorhizobium sp. CA18]MBZ9832537.1 SRPBCC family protein [Mesorhizobium sp. CA2]MBZ9838717.1 SRPBCC family protein [Mesorhizobium sp. CA3]MBZ9879325.1 SRPBCC family protein [Mesorhizobium sp. Ca11]